MRPSSLFKICCGVVLGVIVLSYVFPMIAVTFMISKTSRMSDRVVDLMEKRMALSDAKRYGNGKLSTGGDPKRLARLHQDLLDKAALPGEAARNNQELNVALVRFRKVAKGDSADAVDGFTPVDLDLGGLSRAAALMVAEAPVNWRVKSVDGFRRAKLAIEGQVPVIVENASQGLIAGVRSSYGGDWSAITPAVVDDAMYQFCRSMKVWAEYFNITKDSVFIWKIEAPQIGGRITANDRGFSGSGLSVSMLGSAGQLCQR